MKILFAVVIVFFAQLSQAITEVANGANARVCQKDDRPSVELLELSDFRLMAWEQRLTPFAHRMSLLGLDATSTTANANGLVEVLDSLLVDFGHFDPTRSRLYRGELQKFWQHVEWKSSDDMVTVEDSNPWFRNLPNCKIQQLIVQKNSASGRRYEINRDLWKRLPLIDRAAAILHELIYGELIPLDYSNAYTVQRFNLGLLTNDWRSNWMSDERAENRLKFLGLVMASGMPSADWHGWNIDFSSSIQRRFYQQGRQQLEVQFRSGVWLRFADHTVAGAHLTPEQSLLVNGQDLKLSLVGFQESSSKIRFIVLDGPALALESRNCIGVIELDPQGRIEDCPTSLDELSSWLDMYGEFLGVLEVSKP